MIKLWCDKERKKVRKKVRKKERKKVKLNFSENATNAAWRGKG